MRWATRHHRQVIRGCLQLPGGPETDRPHAAERDLIDEMARLRTEAAAESDAVPARPVDVDRAMDYIRNFAASWAKAQPGTRSTLIQSVYAEIIVRGEEFVSVRLTPEAYAHGLAVALPEEVEVPVLPSRGRPRKNIVLARPTGFERGDATRIRIPVLGQAARAPTAICSTPSGRTRE
jgi:hypothetical protein